MPRSRSTIEAEIATLQAELSVTQPDALVLETERAVSASFTFEACV